MNISCILDYVIIIHVNDNLQCIHLIIIHDDVMIIVCLKIAMYCTICDECWFYA